VNSLSLQQLVASFRMKLWGKAYTEHRRQPGWHGPLPYYTFICPQHGIVENYPQGYRNRLICPKCQEAKRLHHRRAGQ